MPILSIIVTLVVIGLVLWAVDTLIPMDPKIRQIMHVVVIVLVAIWLLSLFVPLANIGNVRVGRVGSP